MDQDVNRWGESSGADIRKRKRENTNNSRREKQGQKVNSITQSSARV